MKRKILGLVSMLTLCACAQPAFALGNYDVKISQSKPSGVSFSKAWERTTYIYYSSDDINDNDAYIGELCYGFDTDWIDEDYTWTRSHMFKHTAVVKNSRKIK